MSTVFLRSANSFCEEVSAGTNASTSTPIGRNIASFQGSPNISNVSHRSISPITRNAGKRSAIGKSSAMFIPVVILHYFYFCYLNFSDAKNKMKGKASLSSIPVKKRKQFSPKILSKDVSKKLKIALPDSLANKINETLNNTLSRESTTTRNMYKQIINSSNDAEESPTLKNSKPQLVTKKTVNKRPDGPIDLKKMFKNNILNNKQTKVKSVESNVSSEIGSGNSRRSPKSFSKRKLYSNASEFTDNENVGEKSFLEKKTMVNIYDSSKKSSETDCGIPQKTSGDKEKETSTKNINGDVYSLRKSKTSKNYFGENIPEKSIIYNTATKTDTNKYVSNLLNGIINKKNLKSSDSQTVEENVESTMEESGTENLFLLQDDSENNVKKKRTNKPKPVPIRKIKQKENKSAAAKNKTSKKQCNEIDQKKPRKSGPLKHKDSGKKMTAPAKRNTLKQKISDSLQKTNHQLKKSVNNPVLKKYKNVKNIRETNATQDDVSINRNRILKKSAYNKHGMRNKGNFFINSPNLGNFQLIFQSFFCRKL